MDLKKLKGGLGKILGKADEISTMEYAEKALGTTEEYIGKGFDAAKNASQKIFSPESLDTVKGMIRSPKEMLKSYVDKEKMKDFEENLAPVVMKHSKSMGDGYVTKDDCEVPNLHTTYFIRPDTMSTRIGFVFENDLGGKINVARDGTLDILVYDDGLLEKARDMEKEWNARFGHGTARMRKGDNHRD